MGDVLLFAPIARNPPQPVCRAVPVAGKPMAAQTTMPTTSMALRIPVLMHRWRVHRLHASGQRMHKGSRANPPTNPPGLYSSPDVPPPCTLEGAARAADRLSSTSKLLRGSCESSAMCCPEQGSPFILRRDHRSSDLARARACASHCCGAGCLLPARA